MKRKLESMEDLLQAVEYYGCLLYTSFLAITRKKTPDQFMRLFVTSCFVAAQTMTMRSSLLTTRVKTERGRLSGKSAKRIPASRPFLMQKTLGSLTAVSYTHLDVYKRQYLYAPVWIEWILVPNW